MHTYTPQTFTLPPLDGISEKQLEVHLGLYAGYVKHINLLREQLADLTVTDPEKYAFAIESVRRRLGFEWNGMRMHEFYFPQWEGGATSEPRGGALSSALAERYGSFGGFLAEMKKTAMSRGSGWATLAWDQKGATPHIFWTADHELGQLANVEVLLAMDMWEHAYMVDYVPAEKGKHVEAFFKNLNWTVVEERFAKASA